MSTLEEIHALNLENVEPEHFIELGSEIVQTLREILGDDAVRELYDIAKGDDAEGFGERFSDALERYTQIHGELFQTVEEIPSMDVVSPTDIKESLEELRHKYQDMRETHLSRNIFVSWEKLRVDIAARQNNEIGADGKHKVSGGTIAVDILGIIRGNIFETILEEVMRKILDSIFPAEKDPVITDDIPSSVTALETSPAAQMPLVDGFGVCDTGFVEDTSALSRDTVSALRAANPLYGQYFGFDMTQNGIPNGSMRIWRGGYHQNIDAVIHGQLRSVGIPQISMVEMGQNLYHVSPFGKVLNSEIRNHQSELPIGSSIERLDVSSGFRQEIFEAEAASRGCSVDELKERYTAEVQEAFVSRIEGALVGHSAYLQETAIPEIESLRDSYQNDLYLLDVRETAIKTELEIISGKEAAPDDRERYQELEDKLEQISEFRSEIEQGIGSMDSRKEQLQETLDRYAECREALALPDTDTESRYMLVSNLEKEASGRTEYTEYMPSETESRIRDFISVEKKEVCGDIERYNEENPDSPLREKDGAIFNRFGVSGSGGYREDMCLDTEKSELDSPEELEQYIAAHELDGFAEFHDFLERSEASSMDVEKPEAEAISKASQDTELQPEQEIDKKRYSVSETTFVDVTEESAEHTEQEEWMDSVRRDGTEPEKPIETVQKTEKEEGGYEGDVLEISEAEEVEQREEEKKIRLDPVEAAVSPETAAAELPLLEGKQEEKREEEKDETKKKDTEEISLDENSDQQEVSYDDVMSGFHSYLEDDTYSFGGDLIPVIQDMDTQKAEQIIEEALKDLFLETDMSQNDRLFSLTSEVALYLDQGVMPTIEHLVGKLQTEGMSDHDIAQTLMDMEPYILRGLEDVISMSADDIEQRIIRIGDDVWSVREDSVVNDVTGKEEDPNNLVDLITNAANAVFGDGVGDTAAEQALKQLEDPADAGNNLDFLDLFFGDTLEDTLKQIMQELIPESVREDYTDMVSADQKEFLHDPLDIPAVTQDELDLLEEDNAVMPEIDNDPFFEDF